MADIFVVMGTTGEYSDREEWPVAAYLDSALAASHVVKAGEHAPKERDSYPYPRTVGKNIPANPYDPDMSVDYTGTSYYMMTVPLRTELPQSTNAPLQPTEETR